MIPVATDPQEVEGTPHRCLACGVSYSAEHVRRLQTNDKHHRVCSNCKGLVFPISGRKPLPGKSPARLSVAGQAISL